MIEEKRYKIPIDYYVLMFTCGIFVVIAFIISPASEVFIGFWEINTSRSVLVSDYVAMAGLAPALVNSAASCFLFIFLLIVTKTKPTGKIIATLYLTMGFALFGKNIVNTLPLCAGVWLYARVHKYKFGNHLNHAMMSATISPIVSEIAFGEERTSVFSFIIAYAVGVVIGFIFPIVSESVKRMHNGYCLYNSGIAGGFISTFIVGIMRSMDFVIVTENFWDTEHSTMLAVGVYIFSTASIILGLILGGKHSLSKFLAIINERDRDNNDYFLYYGGICYINIGVMAIIATTTMLLLNIPINGPVLGGIITIAGFAVAGKHLRNIIPVIVGSILAANLNHIPVNSAPNALSILFSTGLAPISCKFGWGWGMAVGFLHVSISNGIGALNGGLNLYNNGFAGGFVAITVVPLILYCNRLTKGAADEDSKNNYGRRKGD